MDQIAAVRQLIAECSDEDQILIHEAAQAIRDIVTKFDKCGYAALALVGAEVAATN